MRQDIVSSYLADDKYRGYWSTVTDEISHYLLDATPIHTVTYGEATTPI